VSSLEDAGDASRVDVHAGPAVTVFAARWCKPCHELERELATRGIAFEEVDVDAQPDAFREAARWTDATGIPLTRVTAAPAVWWFEGGRVDGIATALARRDFVAPTVIFVEPNGSWDMIAIDEAAHAVDASSTNVGARTIARALRVVRRHARDWGAPPMKGGLAIASIAIEGDGHRTPLSLSNAEEWNDDVEAAVERALYVHFADHADQGYADAKLGNVVVALVRGEHEATVTVHEQRGPRWRLRTLAIAERDAAGHAVPMLRNAKTMRALVRLENGEWFDRARFIAGMQAIRDLYYEAGYGELDDSIDFDRAGAANGEQVDVDARVKLVRGAVIHVARIEVDGSIEAQAEARKLLTLRVGEVLRPSRLVAYKQLLVDRSIARDVAISTERAGAGTVVVHFELLQE
jgi:glutaredoxin